MTQLIQDLVDKINTKTLEKLHRRVVDGFEITLHDKIRVHYTNGKYENFSSIDECLDMLSFRYNIPYKAANRSSLNPQQEKEQHPIPIGDTPLEIVINVITKALKEAQASKTTIYQNKEEILELLRSHRSYIVQVKQSELMSAFAQLYSNSFANDPDMFIYFEAINKAVVAIFAR